MSGAIGSLAIGIGAIGTSTPTPGPTPTPLPAAKLSPPPTRILSWEQLCIEADPGLLRAGRQPWAYEFSNGRRFYDPIPLYSNFGITDDFGTPIQDDFGNVIRSDDANTQNVVQEGGFPFGSGAFGVDSF